MFSKRMAVIGVAILFSCGCATVENGSDHVEQVATGVGERVQYHAAKVERKTRSVWHWLFGGGDEQKPKPKPTPQPTELPNYPQQYVGKQT